MNKMIALHAKELEKANSTANPACTAEVRESPLHNSTLTTMSHLMNVTEPLTPDQIRDRLRPVGEHQSEGI